MKVTEILNKAKSLPIKTKAILITIAFVIAIIIACIWLYNANRDAKTEVEIQKVTTESEATKSEVKDKTENLKNDVVQHGEFMVKTSKSLINIVNKKPK